MEEEGGEGGGGRGREEGGRGRREGEEEGGGGRGRREERVKKVNEYVDRGVENTFKLPISPQNCTR